MQGLYDSKNLHVRQIGLRSRAFWQKYAILKPNNIRICLSKQDQAGSYNYVGYR